MRYFWKVSILFYCLVLVACGGSSGTDNGDGLPEVDTGDEGARGDGLDVQTPGQAISAMNFSWPPEFSERSGRDSFIVDPDNYDFQRGAILANSDNSIVCSTAAEIGSDLSLSTVNAQVVSGYDGTIVSVNDISVGGISGQEAILSNTNSDGVDIIDIAHHYFIPAALVALDTDDAAVFYFRCSSIASDYSQNEAIMRSILSSINFTSSPVTSSYQMSRESLAVVLPGSIESR